MHKLNRPISVGFLCGELGLEYSGDENKLIESIAPLNGVSDSCLTFSIKDSYQSFEDIFPIVLCSTVKDGVTTIITSGPRLDFIRALEFIDKTVGFQKSQIPPIIHETVTISEGVVIENGVTIGEGSYIEPNVTIHENTKIGRNCLIRSNSSIGSSGFGFERTAEGIPIKFIHLGGVSIGDNVEIGSCTCIAKGTMSDTIIESNVKIDNLVHIAHNCKIKEGSFVIACAEVSGGVEVGKNSWVAPNSSINQKLVIGENSIVGLGAVVTKNIPDNTVFAGNPAKKLRDL